MERKMDEMEAEGTYDDDLPPKQRRVEGRNVSWRLSIIFWQSPEEREPHSPHQTRESDTHWYDDFRTRTRSAASSRTHSRTLRQRTSPVPKRHYINLLRTLNDARPVRPRCNRCTALVAKVDGEVYGSTA